MSERAGRKIHLVRHADAGDRSSWAGDDRLRPLSARGARQARALIGHLGGRPIARLVSSPARRCVATLEPLAAHVQRPLETVGYLAEGSDVLRCSELLVAEALELAPGGELVACSHGDVIPYVVESIVDSGARYSGTRTTPKAVTFTFDLDGATVVSIERIPPTG